MSVRTEDTIRGGLGLNFSRRAKGLISISAHWFAPRGGEALLRNKCTWSVASSRLGRLARTASKPLFGEWL